VARLVSKFQFLSSVEAETPTGVWGWAKRLIEALLKWRWFDLLDVPINDKPYYVMRVNATGDGVEYAPEELGLTGQNLTGLAKQVVRVNDTEDGYIISKEVLHSLIGIALAGKAYNLMRVKADETGFTYDDRLNTLLSTSLAGKAGKAVIVNAAETGYELAP